MPNNKASKKERVLMGTAVAALAAGVYFLNTPQGKRRVKSMKGWMVKMRGEVLEKLESLEEVTEPIYRNTVDAVANAEMLARKIPRSEILTLSRDLKRQWNSIKRLADKGRK
jgi:hypothetical protein